LLIGGHVELERLKKTECRARLSCRLQTLIPLILFFALLFPSPCFAETPISFGETISATISGPGELDLYSFQAEAGDMVLVTMSTTTFLDPYARLYGPDGSLLYTGYNENGPGVAGFHSGALPTTGTYKVAVGDYGNGTETGSYGIFVQRMNNPSMARQITFGEIVTASIDVIGELDTYSFDAIAGDVVLVRVSTTSIYFDPFVNYYDPDGNRLQNWIHTGPGTVEFTTGSIPKDGTYKLLVSDDYLNDTGPYTISVQRLNNPGMAMPIGFGETISTSVSSPGEMDAYTFDAVAGDIVVMGMGTASIYLDSYIRLYGPDGALLSTAYAENGPEVAGIRTSPLPATGTYMVLVGDYGDGLDTGAYGLSIQRVNNPSLAEPLAFGETFPASIDVVGEFDTYTFDAVEGDVIVVRMSTTSIYLDPSISIYDPEGTWLGYWTKAGPETLEFLINPIPKTGRYTFLPRDDHWNDIGPYTITVLRTNNPGKTKPMNFGDTLSASLAYPGEVDVYSFDALAGDKVSIRLSTTSIYLDPFIQLLTPDGFAFWIWYLQSGPGTIEIQPDPLPVTGTYHVLVLDSGDGIDTGPYTLSINLILGTVGSLTVLSTDGINSTGVIGGPFNPAGITYTLENHGQNSIQWNLTKTQVWLEALPGSGTLGPGESTEVVVSIGSSANSLGVGTYKDTLTFTNITEANRTILRSALLVVKPLEGILDVSPGPFNASGPPGGAFSPEGKTYTLTNVGSAPMDWRASKNAYWLTLSNDHGSLPAGGTAQVTVFLNDASENLALGIYQDRISFTNTTTGSGDTIRDVSLSVGVSPSTITCEVSKDIFVLGEPLQISGQVTPRPSQAGAFVDVSFVHSGVSEAHRTALANSQGFFAYDVACVDINRAGEWTVRASWAGDQGLEGAISVDRVLEVSKAESHVSANAASQAIKFDEAVDISGKFTPQPDCGGDLTGIPLELHFSGPGGRSDVQNVATIDRYGHYVLQDYAGFTALGDWTIQAKFIGNDAYLASTSPQIQIKVVETAGYAIIVQGKIQSEEGLASHKKTTKFVYNLLKARGLLDDDIKYFTYDASQPGYDGIPSEAAVQQAITQWARDKMNAKPANLYLILVDHGFDEAFYVYPDTITSTDLDGWVDTLQGSLAGQAAEQEIIIVLGFCRSGSFIDNLSGAHRVIIASAAASESSYKGPLDADSIREGEYFVSEFFKSVAYGKSVKGCFERACAMTQLFTASGKLKANALYHDDSYQHPLLDDNGDGLGSHDLSDPTGDGVLSSALYIGVSALTGNDPEDVSVAQVAPATFLSETQTATDLWAKVSNNSRMDTLWVEIKAPGTIPIDPKGSGQAEMNLPKSVYQAYNPSIDRYEWGNQGTFSEPGTYQILYFAKDVNTGNVSPLVESKVYKAKTGNTPPGVFSLVSPNNGDSVLTMVVLDWEDAVDPEGDRLTYTVLLSKGDPGFTNSLRKEGLIYSTCLVGPEDALEDLSTYYWKVLAIDAFGAIRESDIRVFNTNNTNPAAAYINGYVFNGKTKAAVTNAVVNISGINLNTALEGYYIGQVPPGTHTITVNAAGFKAQSFSGVTIGDGAVVTKEFALTAFRPGDLNGDNVVDMADCILAIRIMNGADVGTADVMAADVNGDGKIGLQDVIYILQKAAGLR
jgi:hypothetical protein